MVALDLQHNKKVFYLPIDVFETYPDLQAYAANDCSVKKVNRRNFMQLTKMLVIWLTRNLIEKIPSDTFEDLTLLVELQLRKNLSILIEFFLI